MGATEAKRKRAAPARRRAWRRIGADKPDGGLGVAVTITDGEVAVVVRGPEARVEPMVDRMLRELPEAR